MSPEPLARLPEPITDERYGDGWRLPFKGQEVVVFVRPHLVGDLDVDPPIDEEIAEAQAWVSANVRAVEAEIPFLPLPQPEPSEPITETTSNTKESSERKNRVEVTGRVGKTPELKQTAKGVPITKFPLAEHPDGKEGDTVWHTIVSFKALAQKVSETVKKGDEVKVIGYRQERSYNNKTNVEINAVVVKTPKAPDAPAS